MFSKAAIIVSAVFAIGAMADLNQCNTGTLQCCNSVKSSQDKSISGILSAVGAVIGDVNAQVGLGCSPINVIGVAGNSCSAQPVCCTNNNFNGVVALGCSPVNANL